MNNPALIFSFSSIHDKANNSFCDLSQLTKNYPVIIISKDSSGLKIAREIYKDQKNLFFVLRSKIRYKIYENSNFTHIVIGSVDEDLILAANKKLLCFTALWANPTGEKINFYGIPIKKIESLPLVLYLLTNTSGWYRKIQVDPITTVYSLMNARTRSSEYDVSEKDLINNFQNVLKEGDRHLFKVLLYYLLGVINRDPNFRDVKDWAIFPSSTGHDEETNMCRFKENVRYMMNGRKSDPLFIRHTPIKKSHTLSKGERLFCGRHFDSICLNPIYRGKLKNRSICVFDDYLTNGTSFETARNLLLSQGVSRIICVALGTFNNKPGTYFRQDYEITGDVFYPGYHYNRKDWGYLDNDEFYGAAMNDITKIAEIFI